MQNVIFPSHGINKSLSLYQVCIAFICLSRSDADAFICECKSIVGLRFSVAKQRNPALSFLHKQSDDGAS